MTLAWRVDGTRPRGRAEVGPRALGHRSILGRADDPETRTVLNRLKGREQWRPLGPSVTAKAAAAAFGSDCYPYMVEAARAARAAAPGLVAAVHVDGTCRPHVPTGETSPRYTRLLREIGRAGTAEAVVNTSFNVGQEPVVNSPDDAVATFLRSDLDVLCLGPFLAVREAPPDEPSGPPRPRRRLRCRLRRGRAARVVRARRLPLRPLRRRQPQRRRPHRARRLGRRPPRAGRRGRTSRRGPHRPSAC